MSQKVMTLLCYWGGYIKDGHEGIEYVGASPKILRIHANTMLNGLIEKIYDLMGWDKRQHEVEITCRLLVRLDPLWYVPFQVIDEESKNAMFDMIREPIAKIRCIEVYLEKKPINLHEPSIRLSGPQSQFDLNVTTGTPHYLSAGASASQVNRGSDLLHQCRQDINYDDDGRNDVNLDTIQEMVANEDAGIFSCARMSNDYLEDEEVEIPCDIYEVGDNVEETEEIGMGNSMVPPHNMHTEPPNMYMEPPAPEFVDVSWVNDAVASQWVPWHEPELQGEGLYVRQTFTDKEELVNAVKSEHIKTHRQFKVTYSTPKLLVLKCKTGEKCPWKLRASYRAAKGCFLISSLGGPHTCKSMIINRDHSQLDSNLVANFIFGTVKADLSLNIAAIRAMVAEQFKYNISYRKAWVAKQKVITRLFGSWDDSYKALPSFMDAMQRSNPGTAVIWVTEPTETPGEKKFKRVFWAFAPSIEGFNYCRPLISVDGTHLYGRYKGTLLIAVAWDANDQLFPLAFAITEGERNDSWAWFMACIRQKVTRRRGLCVISDRHIGIKNAMKGPGWAEPVAYHRYCMRHLVSNFNSEFHDSDLKIRIATMAKEHQVDKFNKSYEEIEKVADGRVKRWLDREPLASWALSHDGGLRYGNMTTNMSEIFNSVLKGGRFLPITALVQLTFYRVNSYFAVRRELGEKAIASGSIFPPGLEAKLFVNTERSKWHRVELFHHDPGYFQVTTVSRTRQAHRGGNCQTVNLNERTCTCQKWQIYHFPCSHVIAACESRNLDSDQYVDKFLTLAAYQHCWAPTFHPIPDKSTWPIYEGPTLVPDEDMRRKKKGRPVSSRLHNEMDTKEGRTQVQCGQCKEMGHNIKTCGKRKR